MGTPDARSVMEPRSRKTHSSVIPTSSTGRALPASRGQAHFATLLDARNADPDFKRWRDPYERYGGRSLHTRSHGEAFLAILQNRIRTGLMLFDEPESALSPQRQLSLLSLMSTLVSTGKSQFIVAAHSPILLTFPGAQILSFDGDVVRSTALEDTSHFQITKGIWAYWKHLQASAHDRLP